MITLDDKRVLVIGLGRSGVAASELLRSHGAQVVAVDAATGDALAREAARLRPLGIEVVLGTSALPAGEFDFVVTSPGVPWSDPVLAAAKARGWRIIGEFELGYQYARCLNVAITGTNGKTTTTELIERMLRHAGLKTIAAGNIGLPVCAVAGQSHELDFLTLEVSSFQLETIEYFRPVVGVLLNITPDHFDRY
ncbi:MAG TPA: Mur ligase family protein, partial [Methylomirabilota bacterium]|nr:Mur ligase family protein [Methylomirabilota bacterium]